MWDLNPGRSERYLLQDNTAVSSTWKGYMRRSLGENVHLGVLRNPLNCIFVMMVESQQNMSQGPNVKQYGTYINVYIV